jgi:hypothetical protein
MRLYVDGALVAFDTGVTTGQAYGLGGGYWHIGGDKVAGWPYEPTSWYFAGYLDEVAVYGSQLTTDKINAHYYSRNR